MRFHRVNINLITAQKVIMPPRPGQTYQVHQIHHPWPQCFPAMCVHPSPPDNHHMPACYPCLVFTCFMLPQIPVSSGWTRDQRATVLSSAEASSLKSLQMSWKSGNIPIILWFAWAFELIFNPSEDLYCTKQHLPLHIQNYHTYRRILCVIQAHKHAANQSQTHGEALPCK